MSAVLRLPLRSSLTKQCSHPERNAAEPRGSPGTTSKEHERSCEKFCPRRALHIASACHVERSRDISDFFALDKLLGAKDDARLCQIVRRKLHRDFVSRDDANEMFSHFTRNMRQDVTLPRQSTRNIAPDSTCVTVPSVMICSSSGTAETSFTNKRTHRSAPRCDSVHRLKSLAVTSGKYSPISRRFHHAPLARCASDEVNSYL